jgi:uncharacterized ParB-like nuclease family protein
MSTSRQQQRFTAARRRATMQDLLAQLTGRSDDLLSFEEVRTQLHLGDQFDAQGVQEIPLDKIVGSVGRYYDFTRAFLPRFSVRQERWSHIDQALRTRRDLPPIDVFQVGDVYFVQDGNHRVSVARANGWTTIRARVTKIPTRVPLAADTSADDLILKQGYAEFLEQTQLDQTVPDQRIEFTAPGGYQDLLVHIEVYRYYEQLTGRQYLSLPQAAARWYHVVYEPIVERIRHSGILAQFPGRTEADLYLWISRNRARLQMRYHVAEEGDEAVEELAARYRVLAPLRWLLKMLQRLFPRLRRRLPAQPPHHIPPDQDGASGAQRKQAAPNHEQPGDGDVSEC